MENRYKDIVEALYEDKDSVHMDTTITYEDGRESQITPTCASPYEDIGSRRGKMMELFLQTLITGIMMGGIYALVALGWTLIYKCSGVLNLAMGEIDPDRGLCLPDLLLSGGFPFCCRSCS